MKVWLDKFPTYDELKSLDRAKEYYYDICHIVGSGYLRFVYNAEYNRCISIDYLECGFLHTVALPIRDKTKIIENKFYNLNKKNYNDIVKFIKLVKESIIDNLTQI